MPGATGGGKHKERLKKNSVKGASIKKSLSEFYILSKWALYREKHSPNHHDLRDNFLKMFKQFNCKSKKSWFEIHAKLVDFYLKKEG